MKIVKLNDNVRINIEFIYSLEREDNQFEIDLWYNEYNKYIQTFAEDPPLLAIDDKQVFQPKYGEENDPHLLELYKNALNEHILSIVGDKPKYKEKFIVILNTGLKINVSKNIYNLLEQYLDKFLLEGDK